MNSIYNFIDSLPNDTGYVLVTMVKADRSVPQEVGAKMLVTANCTSAPLHGTIGGGKVEKEAVEHALELLKVANSTSELKFFHLAKDLEMACGGEVTLFFEVVHADQWKIAIFGAGHVCQTLVRVLENINCVVDCFDSRTEWLDKLPASVNKHLLKMDKSGVETFAHKLSPNTFCLVMTHGHLLDLPVAQELLEKLEEIPYLGIIGSKSKAKLLSKKLKEKGIPTEKVDKIFSPVGLPIGNNTPPEIAISIAAQMLEVRG